MALRLTYCGGKHVNGYTSWIPEAAAKLRGLKSVIVAGHVFPDADAVGSVCGLALGLGTLGLEAEVYFAHPVPEKMRELCVALNVMHQLPDRSYDAVVVLDTASRERTGDEVAELLKLAPLSINIDHHVSNEHWAQLNYVDGQAAASAELVYLLLIELGARVEPNTANLLYAGIHDDTGAFRFSNTTANALRIAATLVELGADPAYIGNLLYFSISPRVLKLRGLALNGLKLYFDGRLCMLTVTQQMLDQIGARSEDCEGLIEEARSLEGVECAVLQREIPGGWKFSLRSKSERVNVNQVAQRFGGGGHKAAAGYRDQGTAEEVEARALSALSSIFS